jgi:hypothetical protein
MFASLKPEIEPMQDADGEEDRASQKETPQAVSKTSEDVSKPRKETRETNDPHHSSPRLMYMEGGTALPPRMDGSL